MNTVGSGWAILLCAVLFGVCGVQAGAEPPEGEELLQNPSFAHQAKGWLLRNAAFDPQAHHGDSGGVRLAGVKPGPGAWSHVGMMIAPVPCDRELRLTCYVKALQAGQTLTLNSFGYDAKGGDTMNASVSLALPKGQWKLVSTSLLVPPETHQLTFWLINATPYPMLASDAHLNVGGRKKAPLHALNGPGVIWATAQAPVSPEKPGQTGVVTFPIPGPYRDQIPLSFKIHSQPANALKSYRWKRRSDGCNWVCEATVAPPPKGAIVQWEGLILVREHEIGSLPKAVQPEVPAEAAAWTRSTACVQSSDPAIRAKAAALAKGAEDVETYVRHVIAFTSANQGTGAAFNALDARRGLDCGGSCTNRANLAAALLRAHGIPARTVSHLPTWAPKLYEHWLVEYWHPGVGWVWVESTMNQFQPARSTAAVLAVSNPEDEDKAFDPIHLRFVMPGAAYLSVCELSKELQAADLLPDDAINQAIPEARIFGTKEEVEALFTAAAKAFEHLAQQGEAGAIQGKTAIGIQTALQSGKATDLTRLLSTGE